ncbi:MAG: sarcinarray family MAST domain-containing protein [Methanosarcinaceae archaeon]|nr:sarcinarray family MAST domain-containing protein [Methanosarcinaceae archaeon]
MDKRLILIVCLIIFEFLSVVGSAASPYISIDVYYNDELYPGTSTPKPLVKIGEPFTLRFDVTVNQYCKIYAELSDIGVYQGIESFTVIEGPSQLGKDYEKIYEENETFTYKWTLKPTERWAGGSMPLDFHYSVLLPGEHESVVNGVFTAAYVTISSEYYDGPEIPAASGIKASSKSSSPTTPAFTVFISMAVVCIVCVLRKMYG